MKQNTRSGTNATEDVASPTLVYRTFQRALVQQAPPEVTEGVWALNYGGS
jgi:hypothetical protein